MGRQLRAAEYRILELIQDHYGPQNSLDAVNWVDDDEAVLWVKNESGDTVLSANLTNLAAWCQDGTIASEAELKREWLQINDS